MKAKDMNHAQADMPRTIVLYATQRWEQVCPVVRVIGPAQQAGLHVIMGNEWQGEYIRFRTFPERVLEADVVVIQRDFPRYAEDYQQVIATARAQQKAVIYELDDLLVELAPQHPDMPVYREARAAILQAVIEADAVTCSSHALRDYLKAFNPNTWVLPNYLNDHLWADALNKPDAATGQKQGPVIIGYLGERSHLSDLEMIKPTLEQILRQYGDEIILRFWGSSPPSDLLEWKNVEWLIPGLEDYREFARYCSQQTCDVFIAPLNDNQFNRCKSSIKFLEYSALGVPGVYSRITPYAEIVADRQNGFLASTPAEWVQYLSQLIQDPSLRQQIGQAARRTVREKWLLSQHAHEWAQVYGQVCDSLGAEQTSPVAIQTARQWRVWYQEMNEHIRGLEQRLQWLQQENTFLRMERDALHRHLDDVRRGRVMRFLNWSSSAWQSISGRRH